MTSPRVSFVISVYNDADRVTRSIGSILKQTYRDFELIVVNDGSKDSTGHVLQQLAESDSRIKVITQENTGLTKALITGCEIAKGEFIARQDSDDWSEATRIEKQVQLIDSDPDIGFVSCFTQYVGPNGEPLTQLTRPSSPTEATDRLLNHREGPPAHGSVMFRKSLYKQVGGYRPEFYFSQDSDLWLRMAEQSYIGYVPEVLYTHRREMVSISGAQRSIQQQFGLYAHSARACRECGSSEAEILALANELKAQLKSGLKDQSKSNSLNVAYLLGSQLVKNNDPRARTYLYSVLKSRPWHLKAWIRLLQSCRSASSELRETVE